MKLIVKETTRDDEDSVRLIHESAFEKPDESNLVDAICRSNSFIKELSLLACMNDMVVGHILYSKVGLEGQPDKNILALAPVAVLPEFQNQGIGTSLINAGNQKADQLKFEFITVLGDPQYYRRFGFRTSTEYGINSTFNVKPEFYMVLPLSHYKKETSGTVVYPQPFQNI